VLFDGSNDNILIPNSASLQSPTNALTVDMWVFWNSSFPLEQGKALR